MDELLKEYEEKIETITLIPSDGGRFEVTANGNLIYSKIKTRRHAEPGEVDRLLQEVL
ncbi:MAG: Rdx family protein [Chloroflexi bacterium]|nr:Rdx family protein [Chloroflexota bacterium]